MRKTHALESPTISIIENLPKFGCEANLKTRISYSIWFIKALNTVLLQLVDYQFYLQTQNRFPIRLLLVVFLFQGETILIEFRQEHESMFGHFLKCFVFVFLLFLDPFEHGISCAIADVL